ncbi:MAG: hypothetical protein J0H65_17165 [Rhizobiales bacterium]|nr:hypothetical protein [Hyphomicrobiales bacterium]
MSDDGRPEDLRTRAEDKRWGATGLFIVGLVIVLALIVMLSGPTSNQEASNVPASPPANSQQNPPQPAQ